MLTREQGRAVFQHVVKIVMQQEDDKPLVRAFARRGTNDIRHLLNMTSAEIDSLLCEDDQGNEVGVPKHDLSLIGVLKAFQVYQIECGNPIGNDWISITPEEYDEYCISLKYNLVTMPELHPHVAPSRQLCRDLRSANPHVTPFLLISRKA